MKNIFKPFLTAIISAAMFVSISSNNVFAADSNSLSKDTSILIESKRDAAKVLGVPTSKIMSVENVDLSTLDELPTVVAVETDKYGNETDLPVEVTLTEVTYKPANSVISFLSLDNETSEPVHYYQLTASTYQRTDKNDGVLYGHIGWIDNFGPSNKLFEVSGTCTNGVISSYYYGKNGYASSFVYGYPNRQSFSKQSINMTGLQFRLCIEKKESGSLGGIRRLIVTT